MATLTTLIGNMQAALTESLFQASTCFYAFDPLKSVSFPPSDQFAVIQPNSLTVPQRAFGPGTGKVNYIVKFEATIWLFVRSAVDQYNREDSYLLDPTYGSVVLTDSVIDLFQSYTATDGPNKYGYELDDVIWQSTEKDGVGWAVTKLKFHTDLTGRA